MLAKTHGQPASPTRLGKEIMVLCLSSYRAAQQFEGMQGDCQVWWCYLGITMLTMWLILSTTGVLSAISLSARSWAWKREQYTTQLAITTIWVPSSMLVRRINTIIIDSSTATLDVYLYGLLQAEDEGWRGRIEVPCLTR